MFSPAFGYSLSGEFSDGSVKKQDVSGSFFQNLIEDILLFFENGNLPFDSAETLEVMRLRDGILAAEKSPDTWVEI